MFLSTKEVADKLKVTKMTISRMVKRGELTPVNSHKDYFIFEASQIECLTLKTSKQCNK
jgi:predicted site-specific integrase-resolvase